MYPALFCYRYYFVVFCYCRCCCCDYIATTTTKATTILRPQDESGWLMEGGLPSINGPISDIVNHPSASSSDGQAVVSGHAASFKSLGRDLELFHGQPC